MSSKDKSAAQRRAGQRADELLPGENSEVIQVGDEASGSPSGGIGSSGMAGLPTEDGRPGNEEFSDIENVNEPQSGRSGGAVGGTPAFKRSSGS
jgi:hypothetical protein